jgi:hypothetical protein
MSLESYKDFNEPGPAGTAVFTGNGELNIRELHIMRCDSRTKTPDAVQRMRGSVADFEQQLLRTLVFKLEIWFCRKGKDVFRNRETAIVAGHAGSFRMARVRDVGSKRVYVHAVSS